MPGLLIDDMPFSLDPASSCSSLFFEPLSPSSPSYIYTQTQLGPFLSSFSVPAVDKQQQQQQQQQPQQQQRNNLTSLSLDSHLSSSSSSDYPLWANASPRFHSADSSSSMGSLSRSQGESAVKELLLEAAAMVAAAKGGGAGGSSGKKTSASSQGVAHQPESPVAAALQKFLPSNSSDEAGWTADDVYSCDEFRMFEFKVRRCMRGRSHDWTECPFAHPGEKARRRDPRRFHYSGAACPDFRKGSCKNGDSCELAHGVFECWLHPARYRTQPCKDGRNCKRRVCFFAHTPEQLRLLPSATPSSSTASPSSSVASSPRTRSGDKQHQHPKASGTAGTSTSTSSWSPTSTLVGLGCSPPPLSPPLSPSGSPPHSPSSISSSSCTGLVARHTLEQSHSYQRRSSFSSSISSPPSSPGAGYHSAFSSPCASPKAQLCDLVSALHQLELTKAAAAAAANPLWLQQQQQQQPAQSYSTGPSPLRPGLFNSRTSSGPCTPTKLRWDCGAMWEMDSVDEEDIASPRLESGRDLRAKMHGRLASRKVEAASVMFNDPSQDEGSPDLNWVNELLVAE